MASTRAAQVQRVQHLFNEWALNGRAEGMERGHSPTARQAFDRLQLRDEQAYLDIGCGNGYTLRWALQHARRVETWGIDVSREMIARAESLSSELPGDKHFVSGIFPNGEIPRDHFDAVFSMEVFYYLPDLDEGLLGVREVLKPGGRFACVVDYYQENADSHSWPEDTGVAMTLWSESNWRAGFERAGLEVIEQCRLYADDSQSGAGSLLTLGTLL